MDLIFAMRSRILQLCGERDLSIVKFADLAGIPRSSLKNIFYKKRSNPTLLTIKTICDGFDMTLAEFFSTTQFDSLEQTIK